MSVPSSTRTNLLTPYPHRQIYWHRGLQGDRGLQGIQGETGLIGPQGSQGIQGDTGPTGPQGYSIRIKGVVEGTENIPNPGDQIGDIWIDSKTGNGWYWNGIYYENLGQIRGDRARVIVRNEPPDAEGQGDLWFDSIGGQLYIWFIDADGASWVSVSHVERDGLDGIYIGDTAPSNPNEGQVWLDSGNNRLYIWHNNSWVLAGGGGEGAGPIAISTEPPEDPNEGKLWFSTTDSQLYAWWIDGSPPGQWVSITAGPSEIEIEIDGGEF